MGRGDRALGVDAEGGILWGWIGTDADYDKFPPRVDREAGEAFRGDLEQCH